MKVNGPNGVGQASGPSRTARGAAPGFSLPDASGVGETAPAGRAAAPMAVSSIDALIALQAVGDPMERRRKAVRRGTAILDVLDEVKISLLDGGVPPAALERLLQAVKMERGEADEPRLQALLDEIETRAAVELAKIEMSAAAA